MANYDGLTPDPTSPDHVCLLPAITISVMVSPVTDNLAGVTARPDPTQVTFDVKAQVIDDCGRILGRSVTSVLKDSMICANRGKHVLGLVPWMAEQLAGSRILSTTADNGSTRSLLTGVIIDQTYMKPPSSDVDVVDGAGLVLAAQEVNSSWEATLSPEGRTYPNTKTKTDTQLTVRPDVAYFLQDPETTMDLARAWAAGMVARSICAT
ncbi:hypothetical protein LZ31DRAFT_592566 [Colletotrichum somersetense]|nr:hypothetical protein LZ31DRAFT_592566 [Colletotrichum somersetense]